LLTYPEADLSL